MGNSKIEKDRRIYERILFPFPIRISAGIMGETSNISETGLCIAIEKPLESTRVVSVEIDLPFSSVSLACHADVIWKNFKSDDNRWLCGVRFLRLNKDEVNILKDSLVNSRLINSDFVQLTNKMRVLLFDIKKELDRFDSVNNDRKEQKKKLKKIGSVYYPIFNKHFSDLWEISKGFDAQEYKIHRRYYQLMLGYLLLDVIEVNRYVNRKPLGYAGDFILLNYYYDFQKRFLGSSSYEKLINYYSLHLFISKSVIARKFFLKQTILNTIKHNKTSYILSVGSGGARELIELIQEGMIVNDVYFDCLDFEDAALDYIKNKIRRIDPNKREKIHFRLINKNLIEIIKTNGIDNLFNDYDLIYSSGLFDYLKDRIATRVIENLYKHVRASGKIIVTNADNARVGFERMYYEMLGEWELIYRSKEDMISWTKNFNNGCLIRFEDLKSLNSFLFMCVEKNSLSAPGGNV